MTGIEAIQRHGIPKAALSPSGSPSGLRSPARKRDLLEPQVKVGSLSIDPGLPLDGGLTIVAEKRSLEVH